MFPFTIAQIPTQPRQATFCLICYAETEQQRSRSSDYCEKIDRATNTLIKVFNDRCRVTLDARLSYSVFTGGGSGAGRVNRGRGEASPKKPSAAHMAPSYYLHSIVCPPNQYKSDTATRAHSAPAAVS